MLIPFTFFLDFPRVPTHQHKDGSCNLGQEDSGPLPIKEEQEEPIFHEDREQLTVKQESNALMVTLIHEEHQPREDPILDLNPNLSNEKTKVKTPVETSKLLEPDCDQQLISISPRVQENVKSEDPRSTPDEVLEPTVKQKRRKCHPGNADNPAPAAVDWNTDPGATSASCQTGEKEVKVTSDLTEHSPAQANENPDAHITCRKGARGSRSSVHTRNHTGNGPFHCGTCGKEFKHSNHLKQHLRIHTGERPFSCKTCGKAFKQSVHLRQHVRIHTGEKPYSCKICGKDFSTPTYIKVHQRIHTGEKPYPCKICEKPFRSLPELKRHIRVHTGERPYSCKTCGKAFKNRSALNVHFRIHTGQKQFLCKVCGMRFKQPHHLSVHMRIHTGPLLCKTCGKFFQRASSLTRHMTSHTDNRPNVCKTCGESFNQMSEFTRHMTKHSVENTQNFRQGSSDVATDVTSTWKDSKCLL